MCQYLHTWFDWQQCAIFISLSNIIEWKSAERYRLLSSVITTVKGPQKWVALICVFSFKWKIGESAWIKWIVHILKMRAKRRIKLFAMNRDCKEMAISEYLPCFLFVFLINTNTRLHEKLNVCFIARPKLQCLKISACDDVYTVFTFQCSSFTYIPASFHNPFSCGGLFARKRCDTKMVQLENERSKCRMGKFSFYFGYACCG